MLKRVSAVFALVVLLFSSCGYLVLFKVEQWKVQATVKEKIKQSLPKTELTLISVTLHDAPLLQWEDEGSELQYHGNFYDVVTADTVGDVVNYYCFNDEDEAWLVNEYQKIAGNRHSANSKNTSGLAKNLKKIFSYPVYFNRPIQQSLFAQLAEGTTTCYLLYYHNGFRQTLCPPPNMVG